jgi:two-component system sensor histidine kinase KdpD
VLLGFGLTALVLPLLTWALAQFRDDIGIPTVMLLFLLVVVLVSALGGLWPALTAALAGNLLVNWYFVPPLYTLTIGSTEHLVALAVFLAVAAVMSGFVSLAARRAVEGQRARAEAEALARLAGSSPAATVLETLVRVLGLQGAAVLHRSDDGWRTEATAGDRAPDDPDEGTTAIVLDADHVLALAGPPLRTEDQRVLDAFARELAASVELGELEAEAQAAGALSAANELRSALLAAVSHDLRTPLAAIKASVTSLRQRDVEWTPEARNEFLTTIDEETDRLNALVGNLLDMSRLQTGALEVSAVPVGLDEVLPAALTSLGAPDGAVRLDVSDSLPRVLADRGLLERALANVIANAIRFSPPGTPPSVTAGVVDGTVDVRVVDRGPGVPREERPRLFKPFQRLGDAGQSEGVGLGLAVAKGFIEAMGGEIEADDTPGGGLTIVARLRAAG